MQNIFNFLAQKNIFFIHDIEKSAYFFYRNGNLSKVSINDIARFVKNQFNLSDTKEVNKVVDSVIREALITFNPHAPRFFKNDFISYFNLFKKTDLMELCEKQRLQKLNNSFDFLEKYPKISLLIENLIPIKNERERFLNFLSTVANERRKLPVCWLFKGSQGVGKNFFVDFVLEPFFSESQILLLTNDFLTSNFQPMQLKTALIAVFNEIKVYDKTSSNAISEKLKVLISDNKRIKFELKGVNSEFIDTFYNSIMFSNKDFPIEIEADDRRYCVVQTSYNRLNELVKTIFNITMKEYIECLKTEVSHFWADLYSYNYDYSLACDIFINETKMKIIAGTRTRQDILSKGIIFKDNMLWELLHSELLALEFDFLQETLQKFELQPINLEYEDDKESTISLWFYDFQNECLQDCLNGYIKNNNLRFLVAVILDYKNDTAYSKIALSMAGEKKRVIINDNRLYIRHITYQGKAPDLF